MVLVVGLISTLDSRCYILNCSFCNYSIKGNI
nr:MAG TPA: hypothetical protein [Caudoviricetes sp.]